MKSKIKSRRHASLKEQIRAAMSAHGIRLQKDPILDGKLHNVDAIGDAPGSKKAWYWAPPDGRYAAAGHHRPTVNIRCKLNGEQRFSKDELRAFRKQWDAAKRAQRVDQEARRLACRERATIVWSSAQPASADHWYLKRKNVQPHGTRQTTSGDLIVPVFGSDGTLHGLQFIKDRKERGKVFLKDTRKQGSYFQIGDAIEGVYGIAEGFATGATLHEVLGIPIVCAFDAGNIEYVADDLCSRFPHADAIVFADNDVHTEKKIGVNPGLEAATAAAKAIGATLVIPTFDAVERSQTDFNDLARVKDVNAVREAFANGQKHSAWPPTIAAGSPDPYTDLANARRLVAAWGRRLAYANPRGWYEYGPPWQPNIHAVSRFAGKLGESIRNEAERIRGSTTSASSSGSLQDDQRQADTMRKWAASSENRGRISATIHLARDYLAVPGGRMDPNPHLLGFPNRVLDLNTRIVRAYQPGDLVSLTLGCPYDPEARALRFMAFLREIFPGSKEIRLFLQCAFGYALLGQQIEHILLIFFGGGRNGKGALLRALMRVFGDYAIAAPPGLLVATKNDRHPVEIATLAGKRLVVHAETNQTSEFDGAKMTGLTGGDVLRGRGMHKDYFDFTPSHLLVMHTNHMLRVHDTTVGFWDRVKVVPFTQHFDSSTDRGFEDRLRKEASGILNWLLAGLWRYKRNGLIVPQSIKDATRAYRRDADDFGTFLREKCDLQPRATASIGELYDGYVNWLSSRGGVPLSKTDFADELVKRGYPRYKGTGGMRIHRGIALR